MGRKVIERHSSTGRKIRSEIDKRRVTAPEKAQRVSLEVRLTVLAKVTT